MPSAPMLPLHAGLRLLTSPRSPSRRTVVLFSAVVFVAFAALPMGEATARTDMTSESRGASKPRKNDEQSPRTVAKRAFLVGDSLGVGTARYLRRELTRWKLIQTHAVGRHAPEGVEIVRARKAKGKRYGPIVVVQLGTNDDPRNVSSFRTSVKSVLAVAGPRRCVIWVNVVRPMVVGTTYDGYNVALAELAAKRANFRVLDWVSLVGAKPGWLSPDGVHLTAAGYRGRAAALARKIKDCRQYLRTT